MKNTLIALVVFVAMVAYTCGQQNAIPDRPTENLCIVDAHDGRWHIEDDTPSRIPPTAAGPLMYRGVRRVTRPSILL